ncbi:hypothetical protein EOM86_11540 [Candidatus Nomurabacteria bacterium]|nr:hypothetical protein [Candidatus Nomurabacteria bacterium]
MIHRDKQDKWFHDDSATTTRTGDGFTVYGNPPPTESDKFKVTNGQCIDGIIEPPIKDESILSEAERIVNGERQADYSDPVKNFDHISSIASAISKENLSPTTCAIVMIAVKLARENYKHKRDNLVDLAGYVEILNRIKENEVEV